MKRLKRWLPPLLTVLLIGVGAAMPWAAARVQDLYGVANQEVWPFAPVSLTLRKDSEIGAVLRLMGRVYDQTDWPGETQLTEGEAAAAALDALAEMDQAGLIESGWMGDYGHIDPGILERLKAGGGGNASPFLFIAEDSFSAVIWICHWKGNACPSYMLAIDDATGLAVSGYIPTPLPDEPEENYQRMERWRIFFQDYYGIEIPSVTDSIYDSASVFIFPFDPEDGAGPLSLSIRLYGFETDFGPSTPWESEVVFESANIDPDAPVLSAQNKQASN